MKLKRPGRRFLRWAGVLLLVAILLIFIGLPFGFGFFATRGQHDSVGDPPDGFEDVSLTTSDGITLGAWYAPPQNGAVIVLVHGSGNSREDVRGYAEMLVEHGFGVLAYDQRGHGESDGDTNLFNWNGTKDVGAAVEFLRGRDEVQAIGGLGLSLGAECLLGAASTYPEIQAIVSDGGSYRSLEEYTDLPANESLARNFTSRVLFFSVGLFSGDDPPLPLRDSIVRAEATRFLFIAAGDEATEVDFNEMFAETVEERGELWVVDGVGHTQAFHEHPDDYEARVIAFFEGTLLADDDSAD